MRSDHAIATCIAAFCWLAVAACVGEPGVAALEIANQGEDCGELPATGAQRFDEEAGCLEGPVLLCTEGGLVEELGCAIHVETGDRYLTFHPLRFTETSRWVACSPEEASPLFASPLCSE